MDHKGTKFKLTAFDAAADQLAQRCLMAAQLLAELEAQIEKSAVDGAQL